MKIELQNINKSFGTIHANKDISLTLAEGRIIGILGENGAGKSTLMKILSGYQPADSGNILIDGENTEFSGPLDAIAHGIGMLQQDPLDVGAFTVLENFIYGRKDKGLFFNKRKAVQALEQQATRFDFDLAPEMLISNLSIAQRQQLEIVRLLAQDVRTLILDEPTTGISAEQKELLFDALRALAQSGAIILLVSHKLEDVIALCDEVAVLRAGAVVAQRAMPLTKSEIVTMMFGEKLDMLAVEAKSFDDKPIVLDIRDLSVQDGRLQIENFNLTVRAGEVIGFVGLDGSGQELVMRACANLLRRTGVITLNGQDITNTSYAALYEQDFVYGAAGRIEEGLIAGLTLTEHIVLAESQGAVVDWREMRKLTQDRIQHYRVRGRANDPIEALSGGNQQRVLISLLPHAPKMMILENPTRGLDVESANWIWQQLLARCGLGAGLIFTSPELDEVARYSNRIVVFYAGRTLLVEDPRSITVNELGHLIGGEFDYESDIG